MRSLLVAALLGALPATASANTQSEAVTLKVRSGLEKWTSRHRYSDLTHLMVRIDGRAPMEEPFVAGGDPCGAYFYLHGVTVRLEGCSPGRHRQIRVRARGVGPNAHTVTVRFSGPSRRARPISGRVDARP